MSDDKLATQLRNLSNELWPPQQRIIADAAARIASLEAELDTVTASLELTLPDTRWLIAEVKRLRAERDGLAAIIEQARERSAGRGFVSGSVQRILAQSPANALAGVKAEAAATALEAVADQMYPQVSWNTDGMIGLLRDRAAAIRSEVK